MVRLYRPEAGIHDSLPVGANHEHLAVLAEAGDRLEVLDRIVGKLARGWTSATKWLCGLLSVSGRRRGTLRQCTLASLPSPA